MSPAERYLRLMRENMIRGALPADVEEHIVAELDALWWQMTPAEQDAVENALIAEEPTTCQP